MTETWHDPLAAIRKRRHLRVLKLVCLFQKTIPTRLECAANGLFGSFLTPPYDSISLHTSRDIGIALDVLGAGLRTMEDEIPQSNRYSSIAGYPINRIDFRLANAAVEGQAEIVDGQWMYKEAWRRS